MMGRNMKAESTAEIVSLLLSGEDLELLATVLARPGSGHQHALKEPGAALTDELLLFLKERMFSVAGAIADIGDGLFESYAGSRWRAPFAFGVPECRAVIRAVTVALDAVERDDSPASDLGDRRRSSREVEAQLCALRICLQKEVARLGCDVETAVDRRAAREVVTPCPYLMLTPGELFCALGAIQYCWGPVATLPHVSPLYPDGDAICAHVYGRLKAVFCALRRAEFDLKKHLTIPFGLTTWEADVLSLVLEFVVPEAERDNDYELFPMLECRELRPNVDTLRALRTKVTKVVMESRGRRGEETSWPCGNEQQ
jgi:hypothetical protein